MDPEFSFPNNISIHLAPPAAGQQKSRAKSMCDDPPVRRKPFHAHRRSAAVSEDLGKMPFAINSLPNSTHIEITPTVPEDRRVAFVEPPCSIPQLSPTSANSTISPRSPRRSSPRRRTMSSFLNVEETPCIDLDEALYSKTLHRRTESLPTGLRSPFMAPPRIIEPLKEEDENREREDHGKLVRNSAPPPKHRSSTESEASTESVSSELNKERKKRFSFFRPSSPRRSSPPQAQSPHKLRDPPSVSSLGIPDAGQRDITRSDNSRPASVCASNDNFSLGEPGPVNPPSPERRSRKNLIPSWVYRRKEVKYL